MTSASTKRRHKRNAASVRKSVVTLHRFANAWLDSVDSNIRHKRQAAARAQVAVVRVALDDLSCLIEDAIASSIPHGNAEIQRLRAAMVYAMDDCERVSTLPDARSDVRRWASAAARTLKAALEKK